MNKIREDVRAEIIIRGRVQKAGYKDFIDEVAFDLNINGNVKNLEDGTVQVICEGKEDDIKELIEKINVRQYPIRVEKIDDKYTTPTGEFKTFEIIRDKDLTMATYERMDSAVRYMREMNSNLGSKIDTLRGDTNCGFDGIGNKIDTLRGDTNCGFDGIGNKIDTLREETNDNFKKMDDNFSRMDEKYHIISERMFDLVDAIDKRQQSFEMHLEKIDKNIEKTYKNIETLLEILVKNR